MAGLCARTGCAEVVRALLLFDPVAGSARLIDVDDDIVGAVHLCSEHADRVNVPSGWALTDDRTEEPDRVAVLLGVNEVVEPEPEPDSPLLKRAFRVLN
ncbi:MAG: hypothetical protein AAGA17_07005 [Actinomycetota bacterium]